MICAIRRPSSEKSKASDLQTLRMAEEEDVAARCPTARKILAKTAEFVRAEALRKA
jgi:hypothetical protein